MISNSQPSRMDRRTATTIFPLVDSSMTETLSPPPSIQYLLASTQQASQYTLQASKYRVSTTLTYSMNSNIYTLTKSSKVGQSINQLIFLTSFTFTFTLLV